MDPVPTTIHAVDPDGPDCLRDVLDPEFGLSVVDLGDGPDPLAGLAAMG